MRVLAGGGRVERREHEGAEMRPGVVGGDAEREGELVARLFGREDGVHLPARGRVARIELGLVVGAHGFHRRLHLGRELAPLALGPLDLGPCTAMTAASPSITPMRPVGQDRMKSGSKPWPAIA